MSARCRVLVIRLHIQDVTGLDDHAPASPDSTGTHKGGVLSERELLSRTGEVGDTGDDEAPLANCVSRVMRKGWIYGQQINGRDIERWVSWSGDLETSTR